MNKPRIKSTLAVCALLMLPAMPSSADNDLTEVVASQDVSIRRGTDKAAKERGIHPKKIKDREKHELDRFAMIRFDSEDFGKGVRAAGLRLQPVNFGNENKSMRFRVYGVTDGDEQDEKFTEKDYDPNAEKTIVDRRISTLLDRRQVSILGNFSTEHDETVLFTSDLLSAFVRADTNGTVTLVIVRETDSGHNSTFAPRQSETPPTLVMKLADKVDEEASSDDEAADDEKPTEPEPETKAEDEAKPAQTQEP